MSKKRMGGMSAKEYRVGFLNVNEVKKRVLDLLTKRFALSHLDKTLLNMSILLV
jgi:hypothetical protein